MNKLLNAEFSRLFKSFIFRLGMAFYIGMAFFAVAVNAIDINKYAQLTKKGRGEIYFSADGFVFGGAFYLIVTAAVFIGVFVGTEYSDGTIRNKFAAGHTRTEVYLSKLTVCAAANIIMNITFTVCTFLLGNMFLDKTELPAGYYIVFAVCGSLFAITLTALYLLFSMLIQSKSTGAIAVILFSIVLIVATMVINARLEAPEYFDAYSYIDAQTGKTVSVPAERNSRYLTGMKRKVYETLYDTIPSCQLYRVNTQDYDAMGKMSVHAVWEIVVFTSIGVFAFRKKDLI